MAQDKSLDYLYRKWLRDTSDETRIVNDLMEARQRSSLFRYCAVILAAVVILLAILMYRERIVRHAIKSAYEVALGRARSNGGLALDLRPSRPHRALQPGVRESHGENSSRRSATRPGREDLRAARGARPRSRRRSPRLAGGRGCTARHEHHWQTRDGARLILRGRTRSFCNKAGRVDYIIATGIDISDREAAETESLGYRGDALTL